MNDDKRIDVVWSKKRDEIFIDRLTKDVERLQKSGFKNKAILKMVKTFDYVKFWAAWPTWAFPVDKLPQGHKWSNGVRYHVKGSGKSATETYIFLPAKEDLYIKSATQIPMIGINVNERPFLRIVNFKTMTANKFLQGIELSPFFRGCVLKFWAENRLRLGWAEGEFTD